MRHYFLCCESFLSLSLSLFFLGGGRGAGGGIATFSWLSFVICDMAKGRLADGRYFLESIHD